MEGFSSPESPKRNSKQTYSIPENLPLNSFAFEGEWNIEEENAKPSKGAALEYKFNAKNVYLVLNALSGSSNVKIILDGEVVDAKRQGIDVAQGTVEVTKNKLYHLIKLSTSEIHIMRIEFLDGNAAAFAFTFG